MVFTNDCLQLFYLKILVLLLHLVMAYMVRSGYCRCLHELLSKDTIVFITKEVFCDSH